MSYEFIHGTIDECDIHEDRLSYAFNEVLPLFPLDTESLANMTMVQLAVLELMISRFTKLQDTIGAKIFHVLVDLKGGDPYKLSMIDKMNFLEKNELLPSAHVWKDMRDLRNHLTHEYPNDPDKLVEYLNYLPKYVKELLDYWKFLKPKTLELLEQAEREGWIPA